MSRTATTSALAPPRRPLAPALLTGLAVLLALGALLWLGAWQLQRKAWKEGLLGRIASLQTAPAEPLNVVLNRSETSASIDFVRVQTLCDGLGERSVHLYGLRAAGPGWRQVTACRLPPGGRYGSLLVDLGFENEPPMSPPVAEPVLLPHAAASVIGVLRAPAQPGWAERLLSPPPPAAGDQWMRRDVAGMAKALAAPDPAPFMLTLERPAAGPRLLPSPLPADLPNRHLEYAITWFGLAAALVAVYAAHLVRSFRRT